MNATAATSAVAASIIGKTITVTSTTTNYEILADDTNSYGLTQATVISEPYFDAQTPRNVTGLVGMKSI